MQKVKSGPSADDSVEGLFGDNRGHVSRSVRMLRPSALLLFSSLLWPHSPNHKMLSNMCDPVQSSFYFWLKHPSVRELPPSATIFDILDTLMSTSGSPSEDGYESHSIPSEDRGDFEEHPKEDAMDSMDPLKTDARASPDRSVPRRRRASESYMPRRISRIEMQSPMPHSGKTFSINSTYML